LTTSPGSRTPWPITRRLALRVIPKAPLVDSRGDSRIAAGLIQVGVGRFAPCHQRSDCERTIQRRRFGRSLVGRRTPTRAGGFCRWLRSGTAWTGARRRRSAGWTARRCVTGSIASTGRVWRPRRQLDGGSQASSFAEQLAQFAQIVEAGPDREKDGVVRWRPDWRNIASLESIKPRMEISFVRPSIAIRAWNPASVDARAQG
jgi:hypothetical protein